MYCGGVVLSRYYQIIAALLLATFAVVIRAFFYEHISEVIYVSYKVGMQAYIVLGVSTSIEMWGETFGLHFS